MVNYGLIGKDISYSFSRHYFASKFEREHIRNTSYANFDCQTLEEVKEYLSNETISGFNVTIPYKEAVIPYLDHLDTDAQNIGAVNTIKRNDSGELIGYNTDHIGFKQSLLEHCNHLFLNTSVTIKALILGTGGASKGVMYALDQLGVHCTYVSRRPSENTLSYNELSASVMQENTLIVNCTPLGTSPNIEAFPDIPYHHLDGSHVLFDLIYNPEKTRFLEKGEQQGATIISGLRMLELQAEAAWEIWQ
ncbi:shikimate 5-dehydrogenase [Dokdonia pacifica]|uniref:Shikimate dehydrogenase n=1 Tax=Dokdonia pacifica TaxID=1627892 RepID=A0A238YU57_9FLAO|nr:shikimate dehydrogenase [Dokdonia pacifica]GGG10217.1 shikimate 5-dehydrogenase [Dokdonia pacifica]SNR74174.1 shikimate dehydrogenase [Dokdonia pacifica]